jgi:hypothetical protein
MASDRVMYKGGAIRITGTVRVCEPEVMREFGWPWPWPFEVRDGNRRVIAVCLDHDTANQALFDLRKSEQRGA